MYSLRKLYHNYLTTLFVVLLKVEFGLFIIPCMHGTGHFSLPFVEQQQGSLINKIVNQNNSLRGSPYQVRK